jgi:hypothetical protein
VSDEHCEFDVHVLAAQVPSLGEPVHVPLPAVQSAFA